MDEMALVTFRITAKMLEDLDALVKDGLYQNRSEAIRAAIKLLLEKHGYVGGAT
ncbi:ribbon-helix-helix domain-containing protein [Thermoproteus tenax]|uniref:Ribbon-helix-helix protein CopG domain-containing protein n=1 Tax=Thermoproteus tenax (strain ATCC 35583 / DSM 2078 / JCM 9277 / NBRC 100435 / Kra 1) TaxID=768679 RepID=G4RN00_THETK|nr:ribbon-helix-helix domain-containing protein [Thermoproteus tenax]CCC80944.1 hypothetical protein TTX_0268 [Thermoproteus tenax Kra 1]